MTEQQRLTLCERLLAQAPRQAHHVVWLAYDRAGGSGTAVHQIGRIAFWDSRWLGGLSDCDSHSPWQRGSNENMNGLLRDYFPKSTDLSAHPPQHLLAVENELNRPWRILGDRAPAELFAALLASESPPVLRRWLEPAGTPQG
jgi:hypothetical protein